jgi:hypothetical protein
VQQMAHQSALFNSRAVAALDHPDLSDPSLAVYVQQKAETRQQRAWKRSRHGKKRHVAAQAGSSQCLLCVLSALLLAAIVATCTSMKPYLHKAERRADKKYRCGPRHHVDRRYGYFPHLVHPRHSAGNHRLCSHGRSTIHPFTQFHSGEKSRLPAGITSENSQAPPRPPRPWTQSRNANAVQRRERLRSANANQSPLAGRRSETRQSRGRTNRNCRSRCSCSGLGQRRGSTSQPATRLWKMAWQRTRQS